MKKYFIALVVVVLASLGFKKSEKAITAENCTQVDLLKKCKKMLGNFEYDSYDYRKVVFGKTSNVYEMEVPLFNDESYRFVFSTRCLNRKMEIAVYNKSQTVKERTLLFSNKDIPDNQFEFTYEPTKPKKIYINYITPSTDTSSFANILWILGYEE